MTDMPRLNMAEGDLQRLSQAASEAMTDSMVERLTATAANSLEVIDRLNDEATREAVLHLVDGLTRLHKVGALDTLIETALLLHAARSAATDSMVERFFAFVEHMANNLGTEDLASLAAEAKGALDDAVADCILPAPNPGLFGMLKMLSQPEATESLRFLLSFGCKLRQRTTGLAKAPG